MKISVQELAQALLGKKCIDISWPLHTGMTGYKNSVAFEQEWKHNWGIKKVRESRIHLSSHAGTHIDAPSHFLNNGSAIDSVALQSTIGMCRVLDLTNARDCITRHDLEAFKIKPGEIILLKTLNSSLKGNDPFNFEFIYLNVEAAQYLVDCQVKAVGIDYLGIERKQPDHETHKILMQADIPIIEGLRLQNVLPQEYLLFCLPLSVEGAEASPARAVLFE